MLFSPAFYKRKGMIGVGGGAGLVPHGGGQSWHPAVGGFVLFFFFVGFSPLLKNFSDHVVIVMLSNLSTDFYEIKTLIDFQRCSILL